VENYIIPVPRTEKHISWIIAIGRSVSLTPFVPLCKRDIGTTLETLVWVGNKKKVSALLLDAAFY
jgi:hypothetical protein